MESSKKLYASFPLEWTVKSTSYQIRYRKAFDINEIDEVLCTIINANGNEINTKEFGMLLGFNLKDLAEEDIFYIYLDGLIEYNLIVKNEGTIQLTEFGQEALQSQLKYKYFYATTFLFENQTAIGEGRDFSFQNVLDLKNVLSHNRKIDLPTFENSQLQQKLQYQLFENNIYNGEIIDIYDSKPNISYKTIDLQCEIYEIDNLFQLSIFKSDLIKPDIQFLIDLPENEELKNELIRKGMFHHILNEQDSISIQDVETYIDLWNWKELAENLKVDWNDQRVFKLFQENGDGSIWSTISKTAPVESIKTVIKEYEEYWNWTTLSERFDDDFIKKQIENFNWDFEELSYKKTGLVKSLIPFLKDRDWDWNYLSKNLPSDFIESHINDFPWDYYEITISANEIFKNTFIKYHNDLEVLISKSWNWRFISDKINLNFLHKNISALSSKLDWHIVLNRFLTNAEIASECLKDESFKSLLKEHLPDNFVVAHQKYLWTLDLIDFFEELNLIQWESKSYINGFDTNSNVKWERDIFVKYKNRIITEIGFFTVSQQISDYSLIEEFSDFAWNWEGISKNQLLISTPIFVKKAFLGQLSFTNNLMWSEILALITNLNFINSNIEEFHEVTDSEKHIEFWNQLTRREEQQFVLRHCHFPWDWSFITKNTTEDIITDKFNDQELIKKWDWSIATRKLSKETILSNIEDLTHFIDWEYLVNEVFEVNNELLLENQLPRLATCLLGLEAKKRQEVWKYITAIYPFESLYPILEATYKISKFEWDWDCISNHELLPTDIGTLQQFKEKINWTIFSESNSIRQKFNFQTWDSFKDWFKNTDSYLAKFSEYWDWEVLSLNDDLIYNRLLLSEYKNEKWNWEYLSEFGGFIKKFKKDKSDYLRRVISDFPKIRFEFLSKRKDIAIDSDLILSTESKDWDWKLLSENENVKLSNDLLINLKDKDWNWKAVSKRKELKIDNETILNLLDKDWDWSYLSNNTKLEFNIEFIEKIKSKTWNWKSVSQHKSFLPTVEILTSTKEFDIDWKYLSQHPSLNPTKALLAKFETKWDWRSITQNPRINFEDNVFIERFVEKWNWNYICESGKITLNNEILGKFKDYFDWGLISANTNIDFSKEIIQKYKKYWNWTKLKNNSRAKELLGNYVEDEINNSVTLTFIDKIEQQYSPWKGSIYHFSHIDNAVEIIKNRKIQSRNNAIIKGDAAGNVVHLRNDAHDYARFYFRPHTPTQFYNEFLGKNTSDGYQSKNNEWVSWYEKARGLGFPKCPIPIFFKFSLQEVLFEGDYKCCISNGNMQTRSTQFGSIESIINKFGFDDLYYTPEQYATKDDYNRYRNYAQQEFLVKDELSFSDLTDFEIVCPTETAKSLLINLLGQEHMDVFSKILVDSKFYNNKNASITIKEDESGLHISTDFKGDGYFVLSGTNINELQVLSGDVTKLYHDKIIFNSSISINFAKSNIQLHFIDESSREWFVYQSGSTKSNVSKGFLNSWKAVISTEYYNPFAVIAVLKQNGYNDTFSYKIRHYTLESHTVLVCNVFEKYFAANYSSKYLNLELFRTLLVLHDIGKTKAFINGNKNYQYKYTKKIIVDLWKFLSYSNNKLNTILAFLEEDCLGDYFQNKLSIEQVYQKLNILSRSCGLDVFSFFKIYMIYYQCDIASYTADAGGIEFLEHLFDYENGSKVFDENEKMIKMSPKYWKMYNQLKTEIENGN